jgi:hypothetical protein
MKTNRNRWPAVAAFGLLVLGAGANTASAQNRYQGSFTLPHEVRWQGRIMPAGDYIFSLASLSFPAMLRLQGPNGAMFVPASGISNAAANGKSSLRIVPRDGKRFVAEICLAELGVHLRYSVPKAPKEELLAKGSSATETVLVAAKK